MTPLSAIPARWRRACLAAATAASAIVAGCAGLPAADGTAGPPVAFGSPDDIAPAATAAPTPTVTAAAAAVTPPTPAAAATGATSRSPAAAASSAPAAAPPSAKDAARAAALARERADVLVQVVPPTPPAVRVEPEPPAAKADLWQRVRQAYAMPPVDGELVQKWEQWYASRPEYVQRMTDRGGRYLFHVIGEIEQRGMPGELALLPFIESAFNPQAVSKARAMGMWQFMPATGKDFELRQNLFRDDRRDVLASTRAALDYLQKLHGMFGDWHLALAAYNWGQGNVQRAMNRATRAGERADYASLSMPEETRNYVPKLQAVINIVRDPQRYGLQLPPLENHPYFRSVDIDRDIDVALAARLAGLDLDEFQSLNPQHNKPVILAAGSPQVLLPYDNATRFVAELAKHRGATASWTAWVAKKTIKPADAARLVGISEARLREINRIPPRMLVKAGSTLLVPRGAHATGDVALDVADNATMSLAAEPPPLRRVAFKAGRKGDSVAAVARRHRVSVAQVAAWNKVSTAARFQPGQLIVVMVPAKQSARAGRVAPTPRSARARAPKAGVRASRAHRKATPARSSRPARAAAPKRSSRAGAAASR